MRILVGYDGSTCSDVVLADLHHAGIPDGSTILLLGVAEFDFATGENLTQAEFFERLSLACRPEFAHTMDVLHEMHRLTDHAARSLQARHPQWRIAGDARVGLPAAALLEQADEMDADLIILGSHGRSGFHRWMFGSVSRQVLKDTRRAVRIVHQAAATVDRPPRLLVRLEGVVLQEEVKAVSRTLSRHQWPVGTDIRVLVVAGRPGDGAVCEDLERAFTCRQLLPAVINAAGLSDEAIVSHARLWQADCVFVAWQAGHHKLSDAKFIETLLTQAHCAVEVAPVDSPVPLNGGSR